MAKVAQASLDFDELSRVAALAQGLHCRNSAYVSNTRRFPAVALEFTTPIFFAIRRFDLIESGDATNSHRRLLTRSGQVGHYTEMLGSRLDIDEHPVIDYEVLRRRVRRWRPYAKWVVPIVFGATAGWVLSLSAYGLFCFGIVVGFVVAALSAIFAPQRRFAFGLLGNGCTILVCLVSATINNWRSGYSMSLSELPLFVLALAAIVVVPGLLGIALVSAIDSATRPAA